MSKAQQLLWLDDKLCEITPDPYDVIDAQFVGSDWANQVMITFLVNGHPQEYVMDLFGKERADMFYTARAAVKRMLNDVVYVGETPKKKKAKEVADER
jgi:hypothetical protein